MDPILTTILSTVGGAALKKAIEEAMTRLLKSKKPTVTEKEKQAIAQAAEKMVQVATMDEVKAHSPTWRAIEAKFPPHPPRGPARKSAAKKAHAIKAATKKSGAKKAAMKRTAAKKGAAKRTV
jgi:hypothetical protein